MVAVAVGVTAGIVARDSRPTAAPAQAQLVELPLLVPDELPDGLAVSMVEDLPTQEPSDFLTVPPSSEHRYVYGDSEAEAPYGTTDLDIAIRQLVEPRDQEPTIEIGGQVFDVDEDLGDTAGLETDDVEVRGHAAILERQHAGSLDPERFTRLTWEERPLVEITVTSRTLDRDAVQAIAEDLTIREDAVELGELPDSVERLEQLGAEYSSTLPDDPAARSHSIHYSTPGSPYEGPTTFVSVQPGDDKELAVLAYNDRCDRRVEVRGQSAWLCRQEWDGGTDVSASWLDRPGVLVTVGGWGGVEEDDLLAIAASLRVATPDEWGAAARAAAAFQLENQDVELPGG